jgi:hypothetical protein
MSMLSKLHSESPGAGAAPLAVPVPIVAIADDPLVFGEPSARLDDDDETVAGYHREEMHRGASGEAVQEKDEWTKKKLLGTPTVQDSKLLSLSGGGLVAALGVSALAGAFLSAALVRR